MRLRYLYIIVFVFIIISCQTKSEFEEVELKNYYTNIIDINKPQVVEYIFDTIGEISSVYYLIDKTSENILQITKYDDDFNEIEYSKVLIKPDGAYISEASFVEDRENKLITNLKIHEAFIFPFDDYKRKMKTETSFVMQTDSTDSYKTDSEWEFEKVEVKDINGEMLNTLIAKGKSKRIVTNINTGEKSSFKIKIELWFSEGIGTTKMKLIAPFGTFVEDYKRVMTVEEFMSLKNKS